MRLMITGAAGFIGSRVVRHALASGHDVVAVVRDASQLPFSARQPSLVVREVDLAGSEASRALRSDLLSIDAIVHTAAPMTGSGQGMIEAGLAPLRAIFEAMASHDEHRPALIHLSSVAVYGVAALPPGAMIDESKPLEPTPVQRDAYCRSKLAQEQLARALANEIGGPLVLARPGAVYDENRRYNAHLGHRFGGTLLLLSRSGDVPILHVNTCAEHLIALAQLAASPAGRGDVSLRAVNLLDADLPSRGDYAKWLVAAGVCPRLVDLSWVPLARIGNALAGLGLASLLPGLLRPATYAFRLRDVHYSNDRLRALLGKLPCRTYQDAVDMFKGDIDEGGVNA
ncbi:MAG: NAD(P)-dependent oxidoreductase [Pseudomonadota bacterium]